MERKCSCLPLCLHLWIRKMTSSNENISALLALCAGNGLVTGEFPSHKGQWRGALMFSLICAWINRWVNNGEAGDLRRHGAHYNVAVIMWWDVQNNEMVMDQCTEMQFHVPDNTTTACIKFHFKNWWTDAHIWPTKISPKPFVYYLF